MAAVTPGSTIPNPAEDIDSIANLLRTFLPDHEAISLSQPQNTEQLIEQVKNTIDETKPTLPPEEQIYSRLNVQVPPESSIRPPESVNLGQGPSQVNGHDLLPQNEVDLIERKKDPDWVPDKDEIAEDSDSDATIDMPVSKDGENDSNQAPRGRVPTPIFHKKNYPCFICDETMSDLQVYKSHMTEHVKEVKEVQCTDCEKMFVSKQAYKIHRRLSPYELWIDRAQVVKKENENQENGADGEKQMDEFEEHESYKCHVCGVPSYRYKAYLKHVATHTKPQFMFKCSACSEEFSSPCALRGHIDTKHANILSLPYQCRRCLRRFKLKWSLACHLNNCDVALDDIPYAKEMQYIEQLTQHLKSYETEADSNGMYSCPICTVMFDTPKELQTHLFYHDETKPYKCDQCTRGFATKRALEKHAVMHEPKDDCYCKLCGVQLLTKSGYNAHLRGHRNQEMLQAQTALYLGKEQPELNRETASEILKKIKVGPRNKKPEGVPAAPARREKKYSCPVCGLKFYCGGEKFQAHARRQHPDAEFEQCKLCNKKYLGKENMERHIKLHSMFAETFTCEDCGKAFKRKHALDIHRKLHTFRKFVSCDICGQEFRFVSEVDKHKHTKHRYDRMLNIFKCGICGQKFPMLSHLAVHCHHHNMVDAKPFECDLCQVMYGTSTELKQHIFQVHDHLVNSLAEESNNKSTSSKRKPSSNFQAFDGTVIKDEPMDTSFDTTEDENSSAAEPKTPITSNTKSGPSTPGSKDENSKETPGDSSTPINVDAYNWATIQSTIQAKFLKRHICEVCSKAFASNSDLKTHRRTHSGETPFKCDYCDRSFKQRGHRKLHIQVVHTKEMPYKCDQCDAAFPTRYRHQIHLKRHTGVRDYVCEVCNKEFYTFGKMNEHRKKKHNIYDMLDMGSIDTSVSRGINTPISRDMDASTSRDMDTSVSQDMDESVSQDMDESASQDMDETVSQDTEASVSKDIGAAVAQEKGKSASKKK